MTWSTNEHLANAALWAIVGTYVYNNYGGGFPQMAVFGGLALVYSYGVDMFVQ